MNIPQLVTCLCRALIKVQRLIVTLERFSSRHREKLLFIAIGDKTRLNACESLEWQQFNGRRLKYVIKHSFLCSPSKDNLSKIFPTILSSFFVFYFHRLYFAITRNVLIKRRQHKTTTHKRLFRLNSNNSEWRKKNGKIEWTTRGKQAKSPEKVYSLHLHLRPCTCMARLRQQKCCFFFSSMHLSRSPTWCV